MKENCDYSFLAFDQKPFSFAKTAIIIFNYPFSKKFFLQPSNGCQKLIRYFWGSYYPKSSVHRVLNKYVSISRAPEPDELVWENCGKSSCQLFLRRLFFYLISFMVLALGGGFQLLIGWARHEYVDEDNVNEQLAYSTISALVITLFNYIIISVMKLTVEGEKYDNRSQMKAALIIRIVFFQFLNTGIFVIAVNVVVELMKRDEFNYKKIFIAYDILQIMIINAIVPNVVNLLINLLEVSKLPFRYFVKKATFPYTQLEANQIYEPP